MPLLRTPSPTPDVHLMGRLCANHGAPCVRFRHATVRHRRVHRTFHGTHPARPEGRHEGRHKRRHRSPLRHVRRGQRRAAGTAFTRHGLAKRRMAVGRHGGRCPRLCPASHQMYVPFSFRPCYSNIHAACGPLSAVPPLALPPAALAADVALRSPRLPPRPGRSILSSRNFCHPGISRAKYPGPRAAQSILTPSFPPSEAQSGNPVAGNMVPTRSWIPADRAGALAGMTPDSTRPPSSADNSARRRPRVTARTAPMPAADPGNRGRGDPARIRHRRGPT